MGMFHVIERNVWKRALFIMALLGVATVMYWISSSENQSVSMPRISLFDRWIVRDVDSVVPAKDAAPSLAPQDAPVAAAPRVRVEPIYSGFFDEYRIERDRSRSLQLEQLKELLQHDYLAADDAETRSELMRLLQRTEYELQAEGVLRARGLTEALVVLADSGAIVVLTDSISQSEAGSIGSMVASVTGIPLERITISDGVIAR